MLDLPCVIGNAKLAIGFALLAFAADVLACKCASLTDEEQFDSASHVFVARIRSIEDVAPEAPYERARQHGLVGSQELGKDYGLRATFRVEADIKGDPARVHALITSDFGENCGVHMHPGNAYVIATDDDGFVHRCSFVRKIEVVNCDSVALLERLRARAIDGRSLVEWPADSLDEADRAFTSAVGAGANPYEMRSTGCPRD